MLVLFLVVFIDIIGFGIVLPLLPVIKDMYQITANQTSYLVAIFSAASLLGSVVWGVLSDKWGRKYMLTLPLLATSIISVLSAFATEYWQFFILRALAGFFMANFPVAFAAAADITTPEQRSKAMGLLGMSFSFGFVVGPALGGFLANFNFLDFKIGYDAVITDLKAPFFVSAFFALVSFFIATFFYKESLSKKDRKQKEDKNIFVQFINLYKDKVILFTTYLSIISSLVFAGFEVLMSLWLFDIYSLDSHNIGFYWTFFALSIAFSRLFGGRIFKNTKTAVLVGFMGLGLGSFIFIINTGYLVLILGTFIFTFGIGLVFTAISTRLSLKGHKNQQGTIFGLNQLFGSFGRVLGPILFVSFYSAFAGYIWLFVALICVINALLIVKTFN